MLWSAGRSGYQGMSCFFRGNPKGVTVEFRRGHGGNAYVCDPNSEFGLAAQQALEEACLLYTSCRRQWSLVDNPSLRFKFLNAFDQAMVRLCLLYNSRCV